MAERVHAMEQVVASARAAIARVADYMSCYVNCRRRELAIDVGPLLGYPWRTCLFDLDSPRSLQLSLRDHLRSLNRLFRLLFVWSCQSPGVCILSFIFCS